MNQICIKVMSNKERKIFLFAINKNQNLNTLSGRHDLNFKDTLLYKFRKKKMTKKRQEISKIKIKQ